MVYFFDSTDERYVIYVGVDKYENEKLLQCALPTDLWFHVDRHSSAHVYLRRRATRDAAPDSDCRDGGEADAAGDDPPEAVVNECAHLTRANSIEGSKMPAVCVVYTPVPNLQKTSAMDTGQVGFHSSKRVGRVRVERRSGDVVSRLRRSRRERTVADMQRDRDDYEAEERRRRREDARKRERAEREEQQRREREREERRYDRVFDARSAMTSNREFAATRDGSEDDDNGGGGGGGDLDVNAFEDDFM